MLYVYATIIEVSSVTNRGGGLVEGCGSGEGRGRGDLARGIFARALVWGDVDPRIFKNMQQL
jgi:hypothetical protein